MFQDYMFYGTDVEVKYAFRVIHLSALAQQAQASHGLAEHRGKLLAEALAAGCLIASVLDEEERVNIRVQCGDDYTLATETTCQAEARGYLECNSGEFMSAFDNGENPVAALMVRSIRAKSQSGKLFEGVTKFLTNSLEEAFNDHIKHSYQINAKLKVDSWIDNVDNKLRAFGVIYSELPNMSASDRENLWQHVAALPLLREIHSEGDDPDELIAKLVPHKVHPVKSLKPLWVCKCSNESIERMLLSLPVEELQDMVREAKPLDIKCHYCSTNYAVTVDRQKELLASSGAVQASTVQH